MPMKMGGGGQNHGGNNNGVDLTQLQREYRNMELNRKVYTDESQQVMRRQQAVIEKLRRDNEDMKAELAIESSHLTESSATQQQEQICRLHDQLESFDRRNHFESKRLETLTQQIQVMKHKVLHQKKHMGGVNAAKETQQLVMKQIRILENRLDKSLIKFNEALAQNKVLREEIDNLRRERATFDNVYRKLEKEHNDRKRQMALTIEGSNQAYEQRDAAQLELRSLQEMNRSEMEVHRQAVAELISKLELLKRQNERSGRVGSPGRAGELSMEDEYQIKRKLQKSAWGVAKDKVQVQVSVERVQNFEEAFTKLRAATGIEDLDELVASFIAKEDQNFSLFNYVNEQNNELEKLEEQLNELREEEKRYSEEDDAISGGANEQDDAGQQKQVLKELEAKLLVTEEKADKYEAICEQAQQIVNDVKAAIRSLFNKIGCSAESAVELTGDSAISETNMMQYLGLIEQRANEILQKYAALSKESARKEGEAIKPAEEAYHTVQTVLGLGPSAPMGHEQIQINPPNLEDYSSDDEDSEDHDDGNHALTRDELKARTLKGLRRLNQSPMGHKSSANMIVTSPTASNSYKADMKANTYKSNKK